jgi:murein DD-endopeptidase MepM/ murein hydrolase activator NlpD
VFLWRGGTSIPELYERAALARDLSLFASAPRAFRPLATSAPKSEKLGEPSAAEWIDGEVEAGDSLGGILRREGLDASRADALIRALGTAMDLRQIRPGQSYRLHLDGAGEVDVFEFQLSRAQQVIAHARGEGFFVEPVKATVEVRIQKVGGTIESSLFAAMIDCGEDPSLVSFFVDVFAYDLNFYIDQHEGDTFRMLVEKEYVKGEFVRYGRVLAAEYSGKAGTFRAFYWQIPGEARGRYFDQAGRSVEKTFLKTPLKYSRVSSHYNPSRMHPILHEQRGHWGVDYAAPAGTPVWAAASGKIAFRGERGGAGNVITIEHENGYSTTYMHLASFSKGQKVGQYVRPKDVIGYVGSTGLATGPHLHFGVKKNGHYIDPLQMRMTRGPGVPAAHRPAFAAHVTGEVATLLHVPVARAGVAAVIPMMPLPPPVLVAD